MKFIMFVIDDGTATANAEEMERIDAFNDQLVRDGHWIMAAGIGGPDTAHRFDNRAGRGSVQSGSLWDGPEYFSGFWIIDAADEQQARRLAAAGSEACNRKVELRPFLR